MNHIWKILIELALLGFVAFLYYLFQKSRIIKRDKINIFETLEGMTTDITKHAHKMKDPDQKKEVQDYNEKIIHFNIEQNYNELARLMTSPPEHLSEEFTDSMPSLHQQIIFHIKQK